MKYGIFLSKSVLLPPFWKKKLGTWNSLHGRRLKGKGEFGKQGTRGRKERNTCKETIVFSIFHAQILSVKIVIGQN